MSGENITILEGGKAENFGQVTKLKTSNGSGSDLWVPKTDVKTGHLSVKKNGLYYTNQYEPTASEKKDGKFYDIYGWDTITVSVKKKVTGKKKKKSPKTGKEYDAPTTVDVDEDGNLIETELPVYIEIEQPPDKLEYHSGENISKAGMVVNAYYADDREWGVVPNNEIVLNPMVAAYDTEGVIIYDGEQAEYSKTIHAVQYRNDRGVWVLDKTATFSASGDAIFVVSRNEFWALSKTPATITGIWGEGEYKYGSGGPVGAPITQNLTYYRNNYIDDSPIYSAFPPSASWIMESSEWRGERTPNLSNSPLTVDQILAGAPTGNQTIIVGWTPPEGEEELTDTFDITVIPSN